LKPLRRRPREVPLDGSRINLRRDAERSKLMFMESSSGLHLAI
jgi:hypothetical protein